jgi:murein L,D-transpeptidase YafK
VTFNKIKFILLKTVPSDREAAAVRRKHPRRLRGTYKIHFLYVITSLFLWSCTSVPPTTEKLDAIRSARTPQIMHNITQAGFEWGAPAFIRAFKEEGVLELWLKETDNEHYRLYKTYPICKYSGALGPKFAEGDHQTPEGFYAVTANSMNPWSKYHLSFDIGFPNAYDQSMGRTGSHLMIHGHCFSEGCLAMTNPVIEEIYVIVEATLKNGEYDVPIHIFPFRMTQANMARHASSPHIEFWRMLKRQNGNFLQ